MYSVFLCKVSVCKALIWEVCVTKAVRKIVMELNVQYLPASLHAIAITKIMNPHFS